jgi:hypothetical protein
MKLKLKIDKNEKGDLVIRLVTMSVGLKDKIQEDYPLVHKLVMKELKRNKVFDFPKEEYLWMTDMPALWDKKDIWVFRDYLLDLEWGLLLYKGEVTFTHYSKVN